MLVFLDRLLAKHRDSMSSYRALVQYGLRCSKALLTARINRAEERLSTGDEENGRQKNVRYYETERKNTHVERLHLIFNGRESV